MSAGLRNLVYKTGRPVYKKVSSLYPAIRLRSAVLLGLLKAELKAGSPVSIPLGRRLWLWRRGFTSRADVLFDLTEDNYDRYLSEYQEGLTHRINGEWMAVVDNKLSAHLLLTPFEDHLPALLGSLESGAVRRYPAYEPDHATAGTIDDQGFEKRDAVRYIDTLLQQRGAVVLKPLLGAGGRGVYIVERDSTGYRVNGDDATETEFEDLIGGLKGYLAFEYVEQSSFMADLYPHSTNTVRIVTMFDDRAGEPFVAATTARIGSPESAPLDNVAQGGLLAGIDPDTGELLSVAAVSGKTPPIEVEWVEDHPATGTRLVGRSVPHWSTITDGILRIADGLPQLPYVAWDVLPTGGGDFEILEINSSPGMINTQLHYRFLEDERVRRFYERHGVL